MTPPFSVHTTPHYDRLVECLLRSHPELRLLLQRALDILKADPYNRTWTHRIKKLVSVQPDEGQWRLSLGRFRLHYDIYRQEVVLHYSGLRRGHLPQRSSQRFTPFFGIL